MWVYLLRGFIPLGGRSQLYVFPRGTMSAQRYIDIIILKLMHMKEVQDDNARPRRARLVDRCLDEHHIHVASKVHGP